MSTSSPAVQNRGGLAVALAIFSAPKQAFASLAVVPTWGWAYLIVTLLVLAGSFLQQPAIMHMFNATLPQQLATDPSITAMAPDKQHDAIALRMNIAMTTAKFSWLISPIGVLFNALLQGLGFLIIAKIARSPVGFKRFWAVAMNVAIVGVGLTYVASGIILTLRGPDSIASQADVFRSIPSLAWIVPGAPVKLYAFLASFSVFTIWSTVLATFGLMYTGQVPKTTAIVGAVVLLFLAAAVGAGFAQ